MYKIWGIKNCSTVKKALQYLEEKNIQYCFINYKKTPPDIQTLKRWVSQCGIDKVFNTQSATYRNLKNEKQILGTEEKIELMHQYPTLIKRPVLESEDQLCFGFKEEEYEAIF